MQPVRMSFQHNGRRGFTLVEIMLVVVIIMSLAAMVGPKIIGQRQKAQINITKIEIQKIKTCLELFDTRAGRLPTQAEGLQALVEKPSGLTNDEYPDKIMDEMPHDGWGQEFKYVYPSQHNKDYDLISAGRDKQFGTDDDITNYSSSDSSSSNSSSSSSN